MNPDPANQSQNVPVVDGEAITGLQHKYTKTALFFPSQGQTCFSYCTFCFHWPHGGTSKFRSKERDDLLDYLRSHRHISDVLITGGDPMVMSAELLGHYLRPLLEPAFEHVKNIRIRTTFLSYWPYRILSDADEVLRLFEYIINSGKHLALMTHFNHPQEMATTECHQAIQKLRSIGVVIRTQTPLLKHINDDPAIWTNLWEQQVKLGLIPYYMFVLRDAGPRSYFAVPLKRALNIYAAAQENLSGLAKSARGPVLSASMGKVCIHGIVKLNEEEYVVMRYTQARDSAMTYQPFLAHVDPNATWFDQLIPAPGYESFFPVITTDAGLDMVTL